MANDPLADALNSIKTHETFGKSSCEVKPSKLVRETLKILQRSGFIGDFEFVDDGKSGYFKIKLMGKVNQCGAVKPRFAVKNADWGSLEQKYLPGSGGKEDGKGHKRCSSFHNHLSTCLCRDSG